MSTEADLPDAALSVWHAYSAMQSTKSRHIDALNDIETRFNAVEFAPESERERLRELLEAHDAQVKLFSKANAALKQADASAHRALVNHLASLVNNTQN